MLQGLSQALQAHDHDVAEVTFEAKVVMSLLNRASRAEQPVIEGVALAASYLWRCHYCKKVNPDGDSHCDQCYSGRPGKP